MATVTDLRKVRAAKVKKNAAQSDHPGFTPCSQDMTICGDCEGNRSKNKCPRLKEWLAKKSE
ncbi:MAG TPA: hypothetical protein VK654_08205 [Nitrospirota bacterium]|nr:hypothetical protein [Nitrospirota bacterium]